MKLYYNRERCRIFLLEHQKKKKKKKKKILNGDPVSNLHNDQNHCVEMTCYLEIEFARGGPGV